MPRLPTLIRRRPLDLLARRRFAVGVVGALGVAAALICWRTLPPSRRFVPSAFNVRMRLAAFAEHLRDRTLARLCTVGFAVLGTAAALHNHVGFRLQAPPYRLSPTAVGVIFVLYLTGVGSSGSTGQLSDRVGPAPLLRASLALMILGTAMTLAGPLALVVLGVALVTVGFFGAHAVASGWVTRHASRARAQGAALYLCAYYLGSSVVGSAGGLSWERAGWGGVAAFVGAILAVTLWLVWGLPTTDAPGGRVV